ncbi:fatty acid hydroxylase superfamily-domain-containing protein [Gautieria morchelliformis]|nr:fatty acid hydroxylase superfamily-domain-containing protein [Gautieria morchelliformis]
MNLLNLSLPHFTADTNTPLSQALLDVPVQFPWYYLHRESVIPGISDGIASLLGNVLSYWVASLIYHALDISGWQWLEKYRIQDLEEVKNKNLVTRGQVVRTVAFQQALQTAFGISWLTLFPIPDPPTNHAHELRVLSLKIARAVFYVMGEQGGRQFLAKYCTNMAYNMYWWIIPIAQFIMAFLILDTYQYFLHRTFHEVQFFYKHFHSMHHRLYVPFAFGALYGHPVEGAILDGFGAGISLTLAGMTVRQGILLFAFATYKTVDDHCGYYFPWHPVHMLFGNNAEYHDVHHQQAGIKSNFSQPLFIHWDVILGTRMTMQELRAKKGKPKEKHLKSQ